MKYTTEQRQQKAESLHEQGYNCAQCVMMAFDDVTGINEDIATRMLAGFGAGMGKTKEICGTLAAAASLRGILHYSTPADKISIYKTTSAFNDKFESMHGSTRCGELKRNQKPCMQLIKDVVEMMADEISSKEQTDTK